MRSFLRMILEKGRSSVSNAQEIVGRMVRKKHSDLGALHLAVDEPVQRSTRCVFTYIANERRQQFFVAGRLIPHHVTVVKCDIDHLSHVDDRGRGLVNVGQLLVHVTCKGLEGLEHFRIVNRPLIALVKQHQAVRRGVKRLVYQCLVAIVRMTVEQQGRTGRRVANLERTHVPHTENNQACTHCDNNPATSPYGELATLDTEPVEHG